MYVVNSFTVDHARQDRRNHAAATVGASPQWYLASLYAPAEEALAECRLVDGSTVLGWYDPFETSPCWRDFCTQEPLDAVLCWSFYKLVLTLAIDERLARID